MKLFIRAFFQVFLISANTYFISKRNYPAVLLCGFGINLLWTFNVVKIACNNTKDKIIYATGAAIGGVAGVLVASLITGTLRK